MTSTVSSPRFVTAVAPGLLALRRVGVQTAGQLLVTSGDNRDHLRSETSFARLCGAAPIPVSSGRTDRHRCTAEGKAKTEIMRCLERYIACEVFPHLLADMPGRVARLAQCSQGAKLKVRIAVTLKRIIFPRTLGPGPPRTR
jgi:hypothetical protein